MEEEWAVRAVENRLAAKPVRALSGIPREDIFNHKKTNSYDVSRADLGAAVIPSDRHG